MHTWKKFDETTPGHNHYYVNPPPPLSYVTGDEYPNPLVIPYIAQYAKYSVILRAPLFATKIIMTAKSSPCGNSSAYLTVDIRNDVVLKPMPKGGIDKGYILDRITTDTQYHPSVHNVVPKFGSLLLNLGAYWHNQCHKPEQGVMSEPLHYQRMSLPWGGVFDRNLNWEEPYY